MWQIPKSVPVTPETCEAKHTKENVAMDDKEGLSRTKWESKYHVVCIPCKVP